MIHFPCIWKHQLVKLLLLSGLFLLGGCSETRVGPDGGAPVVRQAVVEASPMNVLTAVVKATVSSGSYGAVEFEESNQQSQRTPFRQLSGESWTIPVLGLHPLTAYTMRLLARSSSGVLTVGQDLHFRTGELPADLPAMTVTTLENPSPGFVLVGLIGAPVPPKYSVIVNNTGRIVWYRQFQSAVADFQLQSSNTYTAYGSLAGESQHFFEMDRSGNIVREYLSATSMETGVHELRIFTGGYALYGVDRRTMDLTSIGGANNAEVRGMTIELYRPSQQPFHWNTFDYLSIFDASPELDLRLPSLNPWHSNAIEIDDDGNLLVSFRNSDEIVKINSTTGGIIWRLGGKKNQFTIFNDPLAGFFHQHGIRRLPSGNIILFDNGNLHVPPQSRAVEYTLNETDSTAVMVWEYRPDPPIFGGATGFAQRLPSGNTLVCFGTANRAQEVTPDGQIQWEINLTTPGLFFYRTLRVDSLY
ncbi:MAG TPA: aryl-sulfate sulfotransferase [Bacteroidota bacterium]